MKKYVRTCLIYNIMCSIIGYLGSDDAAPIIVHGLGRMEYRGYDSAGVALLNGSMNIYKKKGKVADLHDFAKDKDLSSTVGIGHTRWATHGEPNDVNAHPHTSRSGKLAMIHNGIIENHDELREELQSTKKKSFKKLGKQV